jgi:CubicO group peptidase (beta-lactamase class C family)
METVKTLLDTDTLQATIDKLRGRFGVPGVIAGVLTDGEIVSAAAGVTNIETGVEMTPDTVFLTGSITKVWTATLLMTLVDDRLIDLDEPIVRYAPEFRIADAEAMRSITVRHLITHSSGLDGADFLGSFGDNPDAVARYVAACSGFGQVFRPGAYTSYSNADFIIAGWVAEQVTGRTYDDLMLERVIQPLELSRTGFGPHHAILHRAAVGHFPDGEDGYRRTDIWMLPRSCNPAGTALTTTVEDSLRFARMHLSDGLGDNGQRVLSVESARRMRELQLTLPVPSVPESSDEGVGLAWRLSSHGEHTVIWHNGGSYGSYANLFLVPDRGIAGMSFVNTLSNIEMSSELQRTILERAIGPAGPSEKAALPSDLPEDLSLYAGIYQREGMRVQVRFQGDTLTVAPDLSRELEDFGRAEIVPVRLRPVDRQTFLPEDDTSGAFMSQGAHQFVDFDAEGRPNLYCWGARLSRRVS